MSTEDLYDAVRKAFATSIADPTTTNQNALRKARKALWEATTRS
jgi:hypothetical protein